MVLRVYAEKPLYFLSSARRRGSENLGLRQQALVFAGEVESIHLFLNHSISPTKSKHLLCKCRILYPLLLAEERKSWGFFLLKKAGEFHTWIVNSMIIDLLHNPALKELVIPAKAGIQLIE